MKYAKKLQHSSSLTGVIGAFIIMAALSAQNAQANPQGASVVSGQASITTSGKTETVNTSTSETVINWKSFSNQAGESITFNQPSTSSVAINRDQSGNVSQIFGNLSSNGRLVLINPDGVTFGSTANVNAAALIASTANISSADLANFTPAHYNFSIAGNNPNAEIINNGTITVNGSGLAALVGPSVANNGIINATFGTVILGGASTYAIDPSGGGLYSFAANSATSSTATGVPIAPGSTTKSIVANSGHINAQNGGRVYLTADSLSNLVNDAINNTGVIDASSATSHYGVITLNDEALGDVAVSGTLNASSTATGTTGGIKVLTTGGTVVNFENATLTATDGNVNSAPGYITVNTPGEIYANSNSSFDVSGVATAGKISMTGTDSVVLANSYVTADNSSTVSSGNNINITGQYVALYTDIISASGSSPGAAATGNGGNINISSSSAPLLLQNTAVWADGINGGNINLSSAGSLSLSDSQSSAQISASGTNGGTINISSDGPLSLSGLSLSASGKNNGGYIGISGKDSLTFASAQLSATNNGGSSSIPGGIIVSAPDVTSTASSFNVSGPNTRGTVSLAGSNSINLTSSQIHADANTTALSTANVNINGGTVTLANDTITSNGASAPGNGGTISIHSNTGPLSLTTTTVNAVGSLNGGNISLVSAGNLSLPISPAGFDSLNASGITGGGTISLLATGNVDLENARLSDGSNSSAFSAVSVPLGSISVIGNTVTAHNDTFITSTGNGGGSIKLDGYNGTSVTGDTFTAGSVYGNGGTVELDNVTNFSSAAALESYNKINVGSTYGTPGTIKVTFPSAVIVR